MADEPRTPVSADVGVGVEELGRSVGRGAAARGRWPDLEDLRRARAARAWLYRGKPSDDPAVARQVLGDHRRTTRTWARFGSWWMRALAAVVALAWAAALVSEALGGTAASAIVAPVGLLLFALSSPVLVSWIEARRAPRWSRPPPRHDRCSTARGTALRLGGDQEIIQYTETT